jgi:hypothetical protein
VRRVGHAAVLAFAGIVACGGDDARPPGPDLFGLSVRCTSGLIQGPNESEGPRMMPGHACNACHGDFNASMGESSPIFLFAGTAYPTAHEPDGCVGAGGPDVVAVPDGGRPPRVSERDPTAARVLVTDATGFIFGAQVNAAGNFMLEARVPAFVPPYKAKIIYQGRVREMLTPQANGECNLCHTEAGDTAAPGRIVLP